MNRNHCLRLVLAILALSGPLQAGAGATDDTTNPVSTSSGDNSIFHLGLWVEDLDEMLGFLNDVMKLKLVMRSPRATGGERLILSDVRGQQIELLSDPGNVQPHPEVPLHPLGRVAGIAHIAIRVDEVAGVKSRLSSTGYEILEQVPPDFAAGYAASDNMAYRIVYVRGPSAVTFEFFEIRE